MITDGISKSFAIFTYECSSIEWSGLDPIYAKIGINHGGGVEQLHNLSGSPMVNDIDCISGPRDILFDLNIELVSPSTSLSTSPSTTDSNLRNSTGDGMCSCVCICVYGCLCPCVCACVYMCAYNVVCVVVKTWAHDQKVTS